MRLALLALCFGLLSACGHFKTEEAAETSPVAAAGEMYSGIAGIPCAMGLRCLFEDGACYQTADAAGTCQKAQTVCKHDYRPMCGRDGKTYGNKCGSARGRYQRRPSGPLPAQRQLKNTWEIKGSGREVQKRR